MYGPTWPFLFTYGSHDMRHTGFRILTVVNGNPGIGGVTFRLKITQVGKFPTSWFLTKLQDFGTHV